MSIQTVIECAYELQQKCGIRFDLDGVRDSVEDIISAQHLHMKEAEIVKACDAVLEQQDLHFPLYRGLLVQSLRGEVDSDESDKERATGPAATGILAERDDANSQWSVYFPNGTAVWITDEELADTSEYRIKHEPLRTLGFMQIQSTSRHGDTAEMILRGAPEQAPDITYEVALTATPASDFESDNSSSQAYGDFTIHYSIQALETDLQEGVLEHVGGRDALTSYLRDNKNDILCEILERLHHPAPIETQTQAERQR